HARLVCEVNARAQWPQEPAREDGDVVAGRVALGRSRHERLDAECAGLVRFDPPEAVRKGFSRGRRGRLPGGRKLPRPDEGVGERLAGAVVKVSDEDNGLALLGEANLLAVLPAKRLVEEGPDGLRGRAKRIRHRQIPNGVDFAPASTISKR